MNEYVYTARVPALLCSCKITFYDCSILCVLVVLWTKKLLAYFLASHLTCSCCYFTISEHTITSA